MALADKHGQPIPVIRIEKQKSWKRLWLLLLGMPGCALGLAPWMSGVAVGDHGEALHPFASGAAFGLTVFISVLALALAGPAVAFGFWREGLDFTKDGSKLARWWGIIVPFKFTECARAHYAEVLIERTVKHGHARGRHTSFDVLFSGSKGPTWIAGFPSYRRARQASERIAKQLKIGVRDHGRQDRIFRAYDQLDVSVRDQWDRLGDVPAQRPAQPTGGLLRVQELADGADVRIPPAGIRGPRLTRALLGSAAAFLTWALLLSVWSPFAPWAASTNLVDALAGVWMPRALWTLVAIPLVWLVVPAVWRGRTADRLEIRSDALRVHRFGPIGSRGVEIPAAEIEEITVAPADSDWGRDPKQREYVVSVRSDDGFVEFGAGLTNLEREWLRDVLLYYLAR